MPDSIVNQLIAKRNKTGLSVPKLAAVLDIPSDRIYKWEQGHGNPKGSDIDKIKQWLEEVPNSSKDELPHDDNYSRLLRTMENLSEDKIRTTALLERAMSIIEKHVSSDKEHSPAEPQPASSAQPYASVQYSNEKTKSLNNPGKKDI